MCIPEIIRADKRAAKASATDEDLEPGAALRKTARMTPPQWILPKNHHEIAQTVTEGLGTDLLIQTEAPLTTVLSLMRRPATRETILHLVNFDGKTGSAAFRAEVRKQFFGPIQSVRIFSPQQDEPVAIPFTESGEQVTFTVPATRLYGMVVIKQTE